MVLDIRLIDIRSFWRPDIRIVKIAIRFSTNHFCHYYYYDKACEEVQHVATCEIK